MKRMFAVLFMMLTSIAAFAQNSRGSISGQVTDPTGAVIPKANVTVTSSDTGAVAHVTTTPEGFYTVPGLLPGGYAVRVDAPGFKVAVRSGIQLETQVNATINLKMELGSASDVVTVNSVVPLIDTSDASTGQVLTTEEVEDLPTNGGTPLGFARIEYGVVSKAKHALGSASPTSNQTVDDFSLGGGNSSANELLLNGVPNMQDGDHYAAFSPQLDSVTEVRVDVFGANVEYGDTSGGTVNITTKGGTNEFHGSGRWDYQESGCSGLSGTYSSRPANDCTWMAALPYSQKVGSAVPTATHTNQLGGTIGGPIWIPHVFNGHNKLFFFYSYEAYIGSNPPTAVIGTVPTAAERTGDFSALLGISNGKNYQLYNPNTATGTPTNYTRTAIPGNVFANAGLTVSPIAQAYLKQIPLPNYTGPTTTVDGENNYFAYSANVVNYRSHMGRIDYNISSKDKIFGEAHRSRYINSASNEFHDAMSGTISDQIFAGGQIDEVHTFTPTLFSDIRGSVTRTATSSDLSSTGISPTTLGFPGYLGADSTSLAYPRINFTDATSPLSYSSEPGSSEEFDTVQLFGTVTKVYKSHTFLAGADIRAFKGSYLSSGYYNGEFNFTNAAGNPVAPSNTGTPAYFGSAFALFMLGIPNGGTQNVGSPFQYNSYLDAFFLQDDWKPNANFKLSAGIRIEHETPVNESNNRMVNGFNPTATNEATAAAEANYTLASSPLLATTAFQPVGGATYASSGNRTAYHLAPAYFSPRVGMTWSPDFFHNKGVVRLGFGIYDNPFGDYNQGQTYGYTGTTAYVASDNGGMTNNTLNDPFPTAATAPAPNPIQLPSGNTLGVNANLGSTMTFYDPNPKVAYSERTSVDVQYQIGKTILIDVGYINNHQVHLSSSNTISAIPLLPYLSHSPYYNIAATNLLSGATYTGGPATTSITNPFKGVTGVASSVAGTNPLPPSQFLLNYPQYTSVSEGLIPSASSTYNALNARVAKTMGHGLTLNGVFEWSRLLGTFNQLNAGGPLNYGEDTSDFPFHFSGYGTYQLPFGRGRQWLNHNRLVDTAIGGWQVSAIYQFLSGYAIPWGNAIYNGTSWSDFKNIQHSPRNVMGQTVFNTTVFDTRVCANGGTSCNNDPLVAAYNPNIQPNGDNFRTFPAYLLRQDYTSNWDGNVQKEFKPVERIALQVRLDCFNLLNRPQYNTPNVSPTSSLFGTTTGVYSGTTARQFQASAHIAF
jgi:hypothetical protein